jgi:hypothetical protein
MLKAAAISLFAAAIAICILSIASSPSYQECVTQGSQQKSAEPAKERNPHLERAGVILKETLINAVAGRAIGVNMGV